MSMDLSAPLHCLHEDEHILAFDKPSGLLCVPGRGPEKQDCLSARVQAQWPEALVVHRLDMSTSGIVLMARNLVAQRALSLAFEKREVWKRYEAVVTGSPNTVAGAWQILDAPIAADWERRPLRIVDPTGKPSQTRWATVAPWNDSTQVACRVQLEPLTGRTHQLRVHMQYLGHPILGDMLYAPEAQALAVPRLLLHACALSLQHPITGATLELQSHTPF